MINKNLLQYAAQAWQGDTYIKPLSEVSKSAKGNSLVNRPEKLYWFDGISDEIYTGINNKPSSVDGLFFTKDTAYFVEFKTGFKKHRTKENFDDKYAECPQYGAFCKYYKDWFFEKQEKETEELKMSIKFKAIESYITLEKHILPHCDANDKRRIELIVVIDENEVDDYENSLLELSEKRSSSNADEDNCFRSLSKSLQGYNHKKDEHSPPGDYFYDDIKILSVNGFEVFISGLRSEMIMPSSSELQPVKTAFGMT